MLATLAIISGGKIATVVAVFGIYLVDAFYVIFRRLVNGKSPFHKDYTHLHHRLQKAGLQNSQILILVYTISLTF
jgi:UDP-GlcNAc:undecaprenyl-phosphate/decaprenyl-phosphate GlcNAc-1-phosphate transferase